MRRCTPTRCRWRTRRGDPAPSRRGLGERRRPRLRPPRSVTGPGGPRSAVPPGGSVLVGIDRGVIAFCSSRPPSHRRPEARRALCTTASSTPRSARRATPAAAPLWPPGRATSPVCAWASWPTPSATPRTSSRRSPSCSSRSTGHEGPGPEEAQHRQSGAAGDARGAAGRVRRRRRGRGRLRFLQCLGRRRRPAVGGGRHPGRRHRQRRLPGECRRHGRPCRAPRATST